MKKTFKVGKFNIHISSIVAIFGLAITYVAISLLSLARYATLFLWSGFEWVLRDVFQLVNVSSNDSRPIVVVVFLFLQVIAMLMPGVLLGLLLYLAKQKRAFILGLLVAVFAYFIESLLRVLIVGFAQAELTILVIAAVSASIAAYWLTVRIKRKYVLPGTILLLLAFNIFALPQLISYVGRPIQAMKSEARLSAALESIDFVPYAPTYVPTGLTASTTKLKGDSSAPYQNKHIEYSIGKIDFKVAKELKNQSGLFNRTDNCDIGALWYEMSVRAEVLQAKVDASRDNLKICRVLGKTTSGDDVYIQTSKSQFEHYFMQVNDTIIVAHHDKLTKPRYDAGFEQEMLKVFSSMTETSLKNIRL